MSKQHIFVISLGFTLGLAASACEISGPNPDHCRNADGDRTCANYDGGKRPFCTSAACDLNSELTYGCVGEQPKADCYYPCGGDTTDDWCSNADDGGDGDGDGDGDGGENSGESGDAGCMVDADCLDGAAPFCRVNDHMCVGCDGTDNPGAACTGLDPDLTVCEANTCVACTKDESDACDGLTPVCDGQSNVCVGCTDHDQCPASACNLADGSCLDPSAVVHVNGDDEKCGDADSADGTEAEPYCELGDALEKAGPQPLKIILHDPDDPYTEKNEIKSTIALFAADNESPVLTGKNNTAPLEVTSEGRLFVRGVTMANNPDAELGLGLKIAGGHAWVEQCKIVNNAGGGILVDDGGRLVLENSFVGGNEDDKAVVDVVDGEVSVVFSTLVAGGVDAVALSCEAGTSSIIRNSIVVTWGNQEKFDCDDYGVFDSFSESMSFDGTWFVNRANGNFHLKDTYPDAIKSTATWRTGDPSTDIDGAARPTTDGSLDFAGADRLP